MVMSWSPSTSPRPQSLPSPSTVSLFPTTNIITAINTNSTYPTALFTHWSSSMRHCAIFNITMTILMFFILLIIITVDRKLLCFLFCCAAFWISLKKIMSSSCATLLSGNEHLIDSIFCFHFRSCVRFSRWWCWWWPGHDPDLQGLAPSEMMGIIISLRSCCRCLGSASWRWLKIWQILIQLQNVLTLVPNELQRF